MKVLLIDADSKIANIVLMKLSTYHKQRGDTVDLIKLKAKPYDYKGGYDKVYCSVVFTKNKDKVTGKDIIFGGTGIDLHIKLPEEIEHLMPDYSLYPENKYSIGFVTRGCVNKCSFCVVPQKEGMIYKHAELSEWLNPDLPNIMLLDNNFLSYYNWKVELEKIKATKKRILFQSGFDFRTLTEEKCDALLSIKRFEGEYIFAFDQPKQLNIIDSQMNKLRHKFKDWRMKFYVLVGFDSTLQEDLDRIAYLRNKKCLVYIMPFEKVFTSPYLFFYQSIKTWCNFVMFYKSMDYFTFVKKYMPKKCKTIYDIIKEHNLKFDIFDELKDITDDDIELMNFIVPEKVRVSKKKTKSSKIEELKPVELK